MSWMNEGLESTEKKSMRMICKTRHAGTSGSGRGFIKEALSESSDEEFDKFLVENFTPKAKTRAPNPRSAAKTDNSNVLVVSSDDEDNFEDFLQRVKTPAAKANKRSESSSEDSLKNFIVNDFSSDDDFIETKSSIRVRPTTITPAGQPSFRRPFAHLNSPVFVSDSGDDDDEDNIVIRSTWKTRHSKPKPPQKAEQRENEKEENRSPASPLLPSLSFFLHPPSNTQTLKTSPQRTLSAPTRLDESSGSEEEFGSLLERLKKKNILTSTTVTPKTSKESEKKVVLPTPALKPFPKPNSKPMKEKPEDVKAQGKPSIVKPKGSQTEPRPATLSRIPVCKTPGCFLDSLTNPGSKYGSSFRTNKEELTSKLYQFYNTSVFDDKLPTNMSVTWNKKMRKTAGYCITGQERSGGSRYARIDLSEKVCDSADRLRDTLIHEMCHAATWLINGVRDGHGSFWKMYARKATIVHPELPVVTRCHSYDIKYKFQYQCTRCKNTIGRHSKSLDTQKFVCALCTGQLILLTPVKARAPTPFATFVKENYGNVRQELVGQSHAEVMRKLSADFASKTKLSES